MNSSNLMIYPLGGVEEIGSNCTVYLYNGHIIMVDYGMSMYSIDDLTPYHVSYLNLCKFAERFEQEIKSFSIVITHCHDDHIGGLKLLSKENIDEELLKLDIKIYVCHEFNQEIITEKYGEIAFPILISNYNCKTYVDEEQTAYFTYYQVDHSIPYASGVYLQFNDLKIFHTGDWRFDEDILSIGKTSDVLEKHQEINSKSLETFIKLRNKCHIVVSESTNIARVTHYCNEKMVAKEFESIFRYESEGNKEIFFTCFASNIERLKNFIKAARMFGFKISFMGRAMSISIKVAYKRGIISVEDYMSLTEHKNIKSLLESQDKVKIITGCQNEFNSVLNRLVYQSSNLSGKSLSGKNKIIFSANPIPTVRKRVENLQKELSRRNVGVISPSTNKYIHSSGHATRNEIKYMYNLIRPIVVIPVHGNTVAIEEHSRLVKKIFNLPNLKPKFLRYYVFNTTEENTKLGKYQVFNMPNKYIKEIRSLDYYLFDQDNNIFNERKKLIQGGVIFINVPRSTVTPVGTFISELIIQKIVKICNANVAEAKDYKELNFKKIRIQISKILMNFMGEIVIQ